MKKNDLKSILNKISCNGMREMTEARILQAMRESCDKTIDRLRTCIVGEIRRRDVFWKQLRQRDEEIIKLKAENAKLLSKLRKFAEQDKLDNLF